VRNSNKRRLIIGGAAIRLKPSHRGLRERKFPERAKTRFSFFVGNIYASRVDVADKEITLLASVAAVPR
jgi:hypothetical protein